MLQLTDLAPYLPAATPDEDARTGAILAAIDAMLVRRYGDLFTVEDVPFIAPLVADAITARSRRGIASQSVAGASVRYESSRYRGWFAADVLADIDDYFGVGGVRTYRTPAPDGVRYGNLTRAPFVFDDIEE